MLYISGARSVPDEQVRIASTKMDGIGPKKAIQVRYRLGISGNIKMNELTKYQIDQIEQMIGQDHVVHWELKRGVLVRGGRVKDSPGVKSHCIRGVVVFFALIPISLSFFFALTKLDCGSAFCGKLTFFLVFTAIKGLIFTFFGHSIGAFGGFAIKALFWFFYGYGDFFDLTASVREASSVNQPALPSSSSSPALPSGSPSWTAILGDEFGIDVPRESWPTTASTSVNQPGPAGNPVAPPGGEAGPANPPADPYPYKDRESFEFGGDSILSIQRRLLSPFSCPSSEVIQMKRIEAEDLFEVKEQIISLMAVLDPAGDWVGRGARALDNSRTATGEESLERLHGWLEDLQNRGIHSPSFDKLQSRVPLRPNQDEHSAS